MKGKIIYIDLRSGSGRWLQPWSSGRPRVGGGRRTRRLCAAAGRRVSVVWRGCPFIHKRRFIHTPAAPMNGSERDGDTIRDRRSHEAAAVPGRAVAASASPRSTCEIDRRDVLFPSTVPVITIRADMQVLTFLLLVWVLSDARGAMRTPLEAFRPSEEVRVRRPDKLPLMARRWNGLPSKGGLKILYQTGEILLVLCLAGSAEETELFRFHNKSRICVAGSRFLRPTGAWAGRVTPVAAGAHSVILILTALMSYGRGPPCAEIRLGAGLPFRLFYRTMPSFSRR
ncbi:hypothetical protein EVAR_62161_1 [Eumeta japonica]|uniref:Uncharacterized protein n=1 Tax=Eumeta variegata TaxID=151549 RepID=A0A4C1ZLW9_EUMVA|nr:hypothetical protein EVAR_62161_1 [Eumeta japonica]